MYKRQILNDKCFKELNKLRKGIKWSKEEKAFCVVIYNSGPKWYRQLSSVLTIKRTLQHTLNNVRVSAGISKQLFSHIALLSDKINTMDRYYILLFVLQPNIIIDMRQRSAEGLEGKAKQSTLQIMLWFLWFVASTKSGNNQKWKQPLAYFFVKTCTTMMQLKNLAIQIVTAVHQKNQILYIGIGLWSGRGKYVCYSNAKPRVWFQQWIYTSWVKTKYFICLMYLICLNVLETILWQKTFILVIKLRNGIIKNNLV